MARRAATDQGRIDEVSKRSRRCRSVGATGWPRPGKGWFSTTMSRSSASRSATVSVLTGRPSSPTSAASFDRVTGVATLRPASAAGGPPSRGRVLPLTLVTSVRRTSSVAAVPRRVPGTTGRRGPASRRRRRARLRRRSASLGSRARCSAPSRSRRNGSPRWRSCSRARWTRADHPKVALENDAVRVVDGGGEDAGRGASPATFGGGSRAGSSCHSSQPRRVSSAPLPRSAPIMRRALSSAAALRWPPPAPRSRSSRSPWPFHEDRPGRFHSSASRRRDSGHEVMPRAGVPGGG